MKIIYKKWLYIFDEQYAIRLILDEFEEELHGSDTGQKLINVKHISRWTYKLIINVIF